MMTSTTATTPATRANASIARPAAIVALYTLIFFGALPLLLWELGAAFDCGLSLPRIIGAGGYVAGLLFAGVGGAVMLASMASLILRGRGLPISHLPPTRLVARGIYAWMRHPIYVGYSALFAGAGLLDTSIGRGVIASLLLTIGWIIYALLFEEPRLRTRFASYAEYIHLTPLFPVPWAFRAFTRDVAIRAWLRVRPVAERLANHTVVFRVGSGVWVTYGALVACGGVVGAAMNASFLAGWGLTASQIALYQLGLTASMLVCGRLVWLVYEWRRVLRDPKNTILRRVGFVSFGGYLGFLAFTVVFAKTTHLDVLGLLDRAVPPAFLISALGRLGCLSYGCCYGRPCGAHGLRWTDPSSKVNRELGCALGREPRVPTPLLSSGVALVASLMGLLVLASRHHAAVSAATATSMLTYAVLRFAVEHWRDEARIALLPITKGQLLSLPIALAAIVLWLAIPSDDGHHAHVSEVAHFAPSVLARLWPALVVIFGGAFVVCGYHKKEVGRW